MTHPEIMLPEPDRARLAESTLRVKCAALCQENARLCQENARLAAEAAASQLEESETRHRWLVEDIFRRHGLVVGRDTIDPDSGRVFYRGDGSLRHDALPDTGPNGDTPPDCPKP